nr:hypothetical protein [Phreatobacter stygius]
MALAKAVQYDSAGTVEFVAGQDRSFYFLEMNTRLQVEHPVTEMVTGIDLVEQMIKVAYGEKLTIQQSDVKLNGWAVESRIYAEDPYRNFLPSIGRLVTYRPPAEGKVGAAVLRNDTGVTEGGEISLYYDPMIAKLVTWAPTREVAIEAQADALDAFAIDGIQHNIPFLSALMQHPRWRSGELSTGFIAEEYPEGFAPRQPVGEPAEAMAAVAAFIDHMLNARKRKISGQMRQGHRVSFDRDRVVTMGESRYDVQVLDDGENIAVRFFEGAGGRETASHTIASAWAPGQPCSRARSTASRSTCWSAPSRTASCSPIAASPPAPMSIPPRGRACRADAGQGRRRYGQEAALPMPGLVKSIAVVVGQEVKAGEALCGGRGDEDGKRAARRARRQGQVDRGQARRQPGGGRRDHGVRVTAVRRARTSLAAGESLC